MNWSLSDLVKNFLIDSDRRVFLSDNREFSSDSFVYQRVQILVGRKLKHQKLKANMEDTGKNISIISKAKSYTTGKRHVFFVTARLQCGVITPEIRYHTYKNKIYNCIIYK